MSALLLSFALVQPTTPPPAGPPAGPPPSAPPASPTAPATSGPPSYPPPGPATPRPAGPPPLAPATPQQPASPGQPVATTPPGAAPPAESAASTEPFSRPGLKLGALLGVRGCTQIGCGSGDLEVRAGPALRGLLEYRFHPYVSIGGEFGFGYHKVGTEDGEKAFGTSLNLAAMVFAYPLPRTRWDPFVGLGFGFNQDRQRYEEEEGDRFQDWTNRGLLRASLGLDIFVNDWLTVGPRLDYHLQFAGKICSEASSVRKDCVSVSDVDDDFKDELPRWIVFGVQLKARLGRKKK